MKETTSVFLYFTLQICCRLQCINIYTQHICRVITFGLYYSLSETEFVFFFAWRKPLQFFFDYKYFGFKTNTYTRKKKGVMVWQFIYNGWLLLWVLPKEQLNFFHMYLHNNVHPCSTHTHTHI